MAFHAGAHYGVNGPQFSSSSGPAAWAVGGSDLRSLTPGDQHSDVVAIEQDLVQPRDAAALLSVFTTCRGMAGAGVW